MFWLVQWLSSLDITHHSANKRPQKASTSPLCTLWPLLSNLWLQAACNLPASSENVPRPLRNVTDVQCTPYVYSADWCDDWVIIWKQLQSEAAKNLYAINNGRGEALWAGPHAVSPFQSSAVGDRHAGNKFAQKRPRRMALGNVLPRMNIPRARQD